MRPAPSPGSPFSDIVLAAIWGASFLFMRVAAPVPGPTATAEARVLPGGLALGAALFLLPFLPTSGAFSSSASRCLPGSSRAAP